MYTKQLVKIGDLEIRIEGPFTHWYYDSEIGHEISTELYRAYIPGIQYSSEEENTLYESIGHLIMSIATITDIED